MTSNAATPIHGFQHILEEKHTKTAVCGRRYIFVESLKKWLRGSLSRKGPIDDLVPAAYTVYKEVKPNSPWPWPQIPAEQISSSTGCQLLVFSILLLLDQGHLIHKFNRKGINDDSLPVTDSKLLAKIFSNHQLGDPSQLALDFQRLQWQFCPPQFGLGRDMEFGENVILPIHQQHIITEKGATACVSSIVVPEEFVSVALQREAEHSRFFHDELDCLVSTIPLPPTAPLTVSVLRICIKDFQSLSQIILRYRAQCFHWPSKPSRNDQILRRIRTYIFMLVARRHCVDRLQYQRHEPSVSYNL